MLPQWRCSPHQSAKMSSLRSSRGTAAPQKDQSGSAADWRSPKSGDQEDDGRPGYPKRSGRPRDGGWWDTDRVHPREGTCPGDCCRSPRPFGLGKPSKVTTGPAFRGNRLRCSATLSGVSRRAYADRRSTSRLALYVTMDQERGGKSRRAPENAAIRGLCTRAWDCHLTPCLRAVGEMLGPVWISGLRLFVFAT